MAGNAPWLETLVSLLNTNIRMSMTVGHSWCISLSKAPSRLLCFARTLEDAKVSGVVPRTLAWIGHDATVAKKWASSYWFLQQPFRNSHWYKVTSYNPVKFQSESLWYYPSHLQKSTAGKYVLVWIRLHNWKLCTGNKTNLICHHIYFVSWYFDFMCVVIDIRNHENWSVETNRWKIRISGNPGRWIGQKCELRIMVTSRRFRVFARVPKIERSWPSATRPPGTEWRSKVVSRVNGLGKLTDWLALACRRLPN